MVRGWGADGDSWSGDGDVRCRDMVVMGTSVVMPGRAGDECLSPCHSLVMLLIEL